MALKIGELFDIFKKYVPSVSEDEFTVRYNSAKYEFLKRTEFMVKQYTGTIAEIPSDVFRVLDVFNADYDDYRIYEIYGMEPDGALKGFTLSYIPSFMYYDNGHEMVFIDQDLNDVEATTNIKMIYVSTGTPIKNVEGV